MQTLNLFASIILTSGTVMAQTTTQPAQQQATQQPATTTQTQTYQVGQRPASGQIGRPASTQPVQGQVPRASASQDPNLLRQTAPAINTTPATSTVYDVNSQQTSVEQNSVNGQDVITDPQTGTPVVTTEQVQQYINTQSTITQPVQPANTGQVPKAYTNTQTQLPFGQYQPKPTGRIAPEGVTPTAAPRRVR
jgi:hypothetical protein